MRHGKSMAEGWWMGGGGTGSWDYRCVPGIFGNDGYANPHHLVVNLLKYAFHICGVYYVSIIPQ